MRILTINCGSSSLKADVFDTTTGDRLAATARVSVAGIGSAPTAHFVREAGEVLLPAAGVSDYGAGTRLAIAALRERGLLEGLDASGHRIVHGGRSFAAPVKIDEAVMREINAATELAPLHNRPALEAIAACREALPGTTMVASFDTAFFRDLPDRAATYALPADLAGRLGIRRYGFHGLAHRFMAERFAALSGLADARIVTFQLGSGCSAAAIRGVRPLDTSMGFTPLEGLVMSTRSGDLDPAIPLFIAEKDGGLDAVEEILNEKSGLLGLSGRSSDIRQLLDAEAAGDAASRLAVEVFCYRVRKYLGAYAAVLEGLEGVVFGGGIGENSAVVRERACAGTGWLGLSLDSSRNREVRGFEAEISGPDSRVRCYVTTVDEGSIIAAETAACIRGTGG